MKDIINNISELFDQVGLEQSVENFKLISTQIRHIGKYVAESTIVLAYIRSFGNKTLIQTDDESSCLEMRVVIPKTTITDTNTLLQQYAKQLNGMLINNTRVYSIIGTMEDDGLNHVITTKIY